jgi:hypothetical protein
VSRKITRVSKNYTRKILSRGQLDHMTSKLACAVMTEISDYEKKRLETIASNRDIMIQLGLAPIPMAKETESKPKQKRKERHEHAPVQVRVQPKRDSSLHIDYGEKYKCVEDLERAFERNKKQKVKPQKPKPKEDVQQKNMQRFHELVKVAEEVKDGMNQEEQQESCLPACLPDPAQLLSPPIKPRKDESEEVAQVWLSRYIMALFRYGHIPQAIVQQSYVHYGLPEFGSDEDMLEVLFKDKKMWLLLYDVEESIFQRTVERKTIIVDYGAIFRALHEIDILHADKSILQVFEAEDVNLCVHVHNEFCLKKASPYWLATSTTPAQHISKGKPYIVCPKCNQTYAYGKQRRIKKHSDATGTDCAGDEGECQQNASTRRNMYFPLLKVPDSSCASK